MTNRNISLARSDELGRRNLPYEKARESIAVGTDVHNRRLYERQRDKICSLLGAGPADWNSWEWQMAHRVSDPALLEQVLPLSSKERRAVEEVGGRYRWAVTPYYLSLIDPDDPADPIRRMSLPSARELDGTGVEDPMAEEFTNPAGVITRRYPDRLILNVTNSCAMFCRHCQRRRRIGEQDDAASDRALDESVEFIRAHREIRDVLITGGDPLTLPDDFLDNLLERIRSIPHVEIIRLGTRTPVTMPQRITEGFVGMLRRHHPVYLNTQFNHPRELTPQSLAACRLLADAGIPLGNQMVLLQGINNDKYVVRRLNHQLLLARVRPYYIFHAKQVIGTLHFKTSIEEGLVIMEHLRGFTSGMAIPTYIVNAPGGLGKIPLLPDYLVERNEEEVVLRTWEGKLVRYPNQM